MDADGTQAEVMHFVLYCQENKVAPCLTKHHAVEMYGGVEV
jgi:hypothetical protein